MITHQFKRSKDPIAAISSGNDNNCGFHSLAHLWMNLDDDIFMYIYNTFPVVRRIHQEFCNMYQGGEATLEKLMAFKRLEKLDNPWDRELIWGGVFRNVLRELATKALGKNHPELKYLDDGRCVDIRMLKLLSQEMGLDLTVYSQLLKYSDYENPVYNFQPKDEKCWCAELFFNGNHFDFTFGDEARNQAHNKKRSNSFLLKSIAALAPKDPKTCVKEIISAVNARISASLTCQNLPIKKGRPGL
ncbi:MAG: hypothetical protein AB7V32_02915 [Candidatus Berkiella sp.]